MVAISDVKASQADLITAADSLIALADTQNQSIKDLQAQIAAGGSVSEADLQGLIDSSNAEKAKIVDALTRDAAAPPAPAA